MEKQELIEKVVNSLVIHHWDRQINKGMAFNCDYWDCPKKIKTGDKYYVELYPNGHTLSYCLECSAFFMAQALNTLLDQPQDADQIEVKGWKETIIKYYKDGLTPFMQGVVDTALAGQAKAAYSKGYEAGILEAKK